MFTFEVSVHICTFSNMMLYNDADTYGLDDLPKCVCWRKYNDMKVYLATHLSNS